ncbi:MAG: hypothetical protein NC453_12055 [Muribaculum sp.]|nr:hypothetical protein [Muribaculum sp.]
MSVKNIIDKWIGEAGQKFSFEGRYALPANSAQLTANGGFVYLVFTIEVKGFFYDEKHTKPIKLHYERTISIDTTNQSQQYLDDFQRDLNLLTKAAHESFFEIISGSPQPVYTSDVLYMK